MPAYFANTIPVFVRKLKILDFPVDFNLKLFKKPLFGKNKTFRGFFFGTFAGVITVFFQAWIYNKSQRIRNISIIDYNDQSVVLLGFLIGFGSLLGDLIESFFKRRLNIAPGRSWIPFDQCDYILGAFVISSLLVNVKFEIVIAGIIVSIILHFITVFIGYYLGIRDKMV